jgi:hypothetical protein
MADDLAVAQHGFSAVEVRQGDLVRLRNGFARREAAGKSVAWRDAIRTHYDSHVIAAVHADVHAPILSWAPLRTLRDREILIGARDADTRGSRVAETVAEDAQCGAARARGG